MILKTDFCPNQHKWSCWSPMFGGLLEIVSCKEFVTINNYPRRACYDLHRYNLTLIKHSKKLWKLSFDELQRLDYIEKYQVSNLLLRFASRVMLYLILYISRNSKKEVSRIGQSSCKLFLCTVFRMDVRYVVLFVMMTHMRGAKVWLWYRALYSAALTVGETFWADCRVQDYLGCFLGNVSGGQ